MFWKTCLTHAGEILLALGGAWILGYLWNRWFGSHTDPRLLAEYEEQIKSLRDRIKNQDQEIKSGLVRQDTWNSEMTELKESNMELKDKLLEAEQIYLHHTSPADLKNLQAKHEFELKLKQDQIAALTAQRDTLSSSISEKEAALKSLHLQDDEIGLVQSKIEITESKLSQTQETLDQLERQLKELNEQNTRYKHDLQAMEQNHLIEINRAHQELENVLSKSRELENQIHILSDKSQAAETQTKESNKKLEETRQLSRELESKYIQQLETKDQEIDKLNAELRLSTSGETLEKLTRELSDSRLQIKALQEKSDQVVPVQTEIKVQDPALVQKNQELQIQNQHLTNELETMRVHVQKLTAQIDDFGGLEKSVADWTAKSKEWEGRWKEAAKDSEQFKVAHGSLIKERDGQRQHLAQLETDILHFNTVFKEYENKEAEWNRQIELLQAELARNHKDFENRLTQTQQSGEEAAKKLDERQATLLALQSDLEQEKKKKEELLLDFKNLQKQLEEADQNKTLQQSLLTSMEVKLSENESTLNDYRQKLDESLSSNLAAHREAEWDAILKSKEEELKQAQLTIAELVHSNESKLVKLTAAEQRIPNLDTSLNELKEELAQTAAKLEDQEKSVLKWEASNEELHHELQLATAQLAELSQVKESQSALIGTWEQRFAESQRNLEINRQHFAENEKNNQAMETLVAEWEKKYHLVQNELLDLQRQLADIQHLEDSRDSVEVDRQLRNTDLENSLEDARIQLEEYRIRQNSQNELLDEWENKYNELFARFNIVQLQFADTQRIKSHLESDLRKVSDYQAKYLIESKTWQKRLADLEADFNDRLADLKSQQNKPAEPVQSPDLISVPVKINVEDLTSPVNELKKTTKSKVISSATPDFKLASTVLDKKVIENDHQIIEGIGPKISSLLKRNKITSWQLLSALPVKEIQALLDKGGTKFTLADPSSWPGQAKLAVEGNWSALKKFQDKLKLNAKKPVKTKTVIQSKRENRRVQKIQPKKLPKAKPITLNMPASKAVFGKELKLNDLKVIEGVGPKIERLLKKSAILTWSDLAKTKLRPLRAILKKAGNNFVLADPKTWAAQARLASRGQWRRLKTLQDKLNNRK